jgi:hypothetical protein
VTGRRPVMGRATSIRIQGPSFGVINVPLLIMNGGADAEVPLAYAMHLARRAVEARIGGTNSRFSTPRTTSPRHVRQSAMMSYRSCA